MRSVSAWLVFAFVARVTAQPTALGSKPKCADLRTTWENGNTASQCSTLTYDDMHNCQCAQDTDCHFTYANLGTDNPPYYENFKCCKTSEATTDAFEFGRCIDITIESCCQLTYGDSELQGYTVLRLTTAERPATCCPHVHQELPTAPFSIQSTAAHFTNCQCLRDEHCSGELKCCNRECKPPDSIACNGCETDQDCTGDNVCCGMGSQFVESTGLPTTLACIPKANCCKFKRMHNGNVLDMAWEVVAGETLCCPYGSVSRIFDNELKVLHGDVTSMNNFRIPASGDFKCKCNPSGDSLGNKGKVENFALEGCQSGETCCDVPPALANNNWRATHSTAQNLFWTDAKCDPSKPECLGACGGMCISSSVCNSNNNNNTASNSNLCKNVALANGDGCCRYEDVGRRLTSTLSSITGAIREQRYLYATYSPHSPTQRSVCCPVGGVRDYLPKDSPSCPCYTNSDCPTIHGEQFECCASGGIGECYQPSLHRCCPVGGTIETVLARSTKCGCSTDNDCPPTKHGMSWKCCNGKCYNEKINQCCGGTVIDWGSFCCMTRTQAQFEGHKAFPMLAGERRKTNAKCRCFNDRDCQDIKFEGNKAPGDWKCCGQQRGSDCGFCYDANKEQCCESGPASRQGDWGIMGANQKTIIAADNSHFSDVCCPVTGPASMPWQRDLGTIVNYPSRDLRGEDDWTKITYADPLNYCVCKSDADCPGSSTCCKVYMDDPAHKCNTDHYYGRTSGLSQPDTHCSGICINPNFQKCCGDSTKNNAIVCFSETDHCCGADTPRPTCCAHSQVCDTTITDDRYTWTDNIKLGACKAKPPPGDDDDDDDDDDDVIKPGGATEQLKFKLQLAGDCGTEPDVTALKPKIATALGFSEEQVEVTLGACTNKSSTAEKFTILQEGEWEILVTVLKLTEEQATGLDEALKDTNGDMAKALTGAGFTYATTDITQETTATEEVLVQAKVSGDCGTKPDVAELKPKVAQAMKVHETLMELTVGECTPTTTSNKFRLLQAGEWQIIIKITKLTPEQANKLKTELSDGANQKSVALKEAGLTYTPEDISVEPIKKPDGPSTNPGIPAAPQAPGEPAPPTPQDGLSKSSAIKLQIHTLPFSVFLFGLMLFLMSI